jgi:L-rhamnose-H+ transport protein
LIALPATITLSTVPQIAMVYRAAGVGELLMVVIFGACWGISPIFLGIAAENIGIALTFSLVMGTSAAVGAAIPLLRLNSDRLHTSAGHALLLGISTVLLGVATCAIAGMIRSKANSHALRAQRRKTVAGLSLAILCGCGAAFLNLGFAFGADLSAIASRYGAARANAGNAVWLPLLAAGAIPNLLYCCHLLKKNSTSQNFRGSGHRNWSLALAMGVLWFGSVVLYGISVLRLGPLGTSVGWSLFMSIIVVSASFLGIVTGEWKGSGCWPLTTQLVGVSTLIVAICVLGAAAHN